MSSFSIKLNLYGGHFYKDCTAKIMTEFYNAWPETLKTFKLSPNIFFKNADN